MEQIYIALLKLTQTQPIFLASQYNSESINFLIRSKTLELAKFASRNLANSLKDNEFIQAKFNDSHNFAIYGKRAGNLISICVQSETKQALSFLNQILRTFKNRDFAEVKFDCNCVNLKEIKVDNSLNNLQNELEETKNLVYENLENVIKRGQNIDEIYAKTIDLSDGAKAFLQASKKMKCRCLGM
ncbi:Synaptobrevin [Spironucleus salmonicida]|uniref:Synaptobrevin n=1 Tax=Spironucleus salmonicida TaxID=348837 RepID=V6LQZ7_9EUKA|nr:Synaptobrevin [Spironucleus salmonicida]|eukprot:EST47020.1 Synaptobrevin [Spironucleus salmonicida]